MTGLDTNILTRYIVQDDEIQTEQATALLDQHLTIENPGFVSLVTIAELVWVLRSTYGYSMQQVADAVETAY